MPETPAPKTLRTMVLRMLLGFLVLTALVAILDVWTDIDEEGKVLLSAFVLSLASLFALPGAVVLDREKWLRPPSAEDAKVTPAAERKSPVGLATLVLALVAGVTTLWMIWFEPQDGDALTRLVAAAWLWSASVSVHALVSLAALPERMKWMKIVAPVITYMGGLLVTLALYEVFVFEDWRMYLTSTLYILAGLANLAVLIMHMMMRYELAGRRLVLEGDGDGGWRDPSGRRYLVSEG